jgi:predicted transcriptional regulator
MAARRRPTDAELAILQCLWQGGPATVRQVHEALGGGGAYTTVLKTMQIMADKGLVLRDTSQRSHIYAPVHSQATTQGSLVKDLVSRAFGGSTARLVLRALSEEPTDPDELAAIRSLLDQLEER